MSRKYLAYGVKIEVRSRIGSHAQFKETEKLTSKREWSTEISSLIRLITILYWV